MFLGASLVLARASSIELNQAARCAGCSSPRCPHDHVASIQVLYETQCLHTVDERGTHNNTLRRSHLHRHSICFGRKQGLPSYSHYPLFKKKKEKKSQDPYTSTPDREAKPTFASTNKLKYLYIVSRESANLLQWWQARTRSVSTPNSTVRDCAFN